MGDVHHGPAPRARGPRKVAVRDGRPAAYVNVPAGRQPAGRQQPSSATQRSLSILGDRALDHRDHRGLRTYSVHILSQLQILRQARPGPAGGPCRLRGNCARPPLAPSGPQQPSSAGPGRSYCQLVSGPQRS